MKNRKILLIILGLISLVTLSIIEIITFTETKNHNIKIITEENSYGEEFAKKYKLEIETLSDSNKQEYKLNIENYDYNINNKEIEIVSYKGISETIVIPSYIESYPVTKIQENAFKEAKNLKTIIIGYNEIEINTEDFKNIEIKCRNTDYCNSLKENEKLNVTILNDSDPYDYSYIYMPFEYNIKNNEIELTKYLLNENILIIPETLNGYKVTKVSIDILNSNYKACLIPGSVENIKTTSNLKIGNILIITIITNIISYIIFAIINLTLTFRKKEEILLNAPTLLISIIYLLGTLIYSYVANNIDTQVKTYIIVSITVTILFIIISILLNKSKKHIEKNNDELIEKEKFKKEILIKIDDIIFVSKNEYKKELEKIKELIKFMDPISSIHTREIEKEIIENLNNLSSNINKEELVKLEQLIKKRNNICKINKD